MNYKHTQVGYLIIAIIIALCAIFYFIILQTKNYYIFIILFLTTLILLSFSTLTIIVDKTSLKLKFGFGLIKKSFLLKDIVYVKMVKNHWYYGWGIRYWPWPKMWIYNVSGFDAIEIKTKEGKIYRIGTDDSQKLQKALIR